MKETHLMPKEQVALVECSTYQEENVYQAVRKGIGLLGGASRFAQPGEDIVLKPNLLAPAAPEELVTPHPSVFRAAARVFQESGVNLSYGDSPSLPPTETAARSAGIADAAEELGIPLADFENGEDVVFPEGKQNQRFTIARGVEAADGIISLSKMKPHNLTRLTGAIKNNFGCIPGVLKGEFHIKLPDADGFSRMLVDLNRYIKPRLCIMDGIIAMHREGPRGGDPIYMNTLLIGSNPGTVDAVFSHLAGLDPATVPTARWASEYGLCSYLEDDIEILGAPLSSLINSDYQVPSAGLAGGAMSAIPIARTLVLPKLLIDASKCTQCGTCVESCPVTPKVVDFPDGDETRPPIYDLNRCIRCYCCHENCPESAIRISTTLLGRLLPKFYNFAQRRSSR